MTCIWSRFSDKTGGSSAALFASSSIHLFMAKASRGSVFLLFTRSPSWTWLLLSLQPVPIRNGSHATGRPLCLRITSNRPVVSCILGRHVRSLGFYVVRLSKERFLLSYFHH